MSLLTKTLNQIRAWLETHYPEIAKNLPPGLNLSQIEEITETLPFKLTNEVDEIYQWSSGTDPKEPGYIFDDFDAGFAFCSLQQAVNDALAFEDDREEVAVNYFGKPLFPIFQSDVSQLCVIGSNNKQESSLVILVDWDCMDILPRYTNLTSMMLTLLECFETGVLYEVETAISVRVFYDNNKFSTIYRKYNSDIPSISIVNFCQHISEMQNAPAGKLYDTLDKFMSQLYSLRTHWKDLYLDQFSSELTKPLIATTQHQDEKVRLIATKIIDEFNTNTHE